MTTNKEVNLRVDNGISRRSEEKELIELIIISSQHTQIDACKKPDQTYLG
jgi:hypothetical protein